MLGEKINIFEENQFKRLFKIVFFITISNSLVIFWDISGLKQALTSEYLISKAFFLLTPLLLLVIYKKMKSHHLWIEMLLAITYFGYSGYYMSTVHYSYHTAFMQFCIGLIVFLHFNLTTFLIAYGSGVSFFILSLNSLSDKMDSSQYQVLKAEIVGAQTPLLFVTILIFIFIRKKELRDQRKDLFFQKIGESVGFLLHEIKQPLRAAWTSLDANKVEDIEDLLTISDVMWPSEFSKNEIILKTIMCNDIIQEQLNLYEKYLKSLNIKVETNLSTYKIEAKTNRNILKIILRNLIKNAIEALSEVEEDQRILSIELEGRKIIIKNNKSPKHKIAQSQILLPGYTTKKGQTNKGIGLFICNELASKVDIKLDIQLTKINFTASLHFEH